MNAYFQNLIARNLGAPCPLRPRPPSLFEASEAQAPTSGKEPTSLETSARRDSKPSRPAVSDSGRPSSSGSAKISTSPDANEMNDAPDQTDIITEAAFAVPDLSIASQPSLPALPDRNAQQTRPAPVPFPDAAGTKPGKAPTAEPPVKSTFNNKKQTADVRIRNPLPPEQTQTTPFFKHQRLPQRAEKAGIAATKNHRENAPSAEVFPTATAKQMRRHFPDNPPQPSMEFPIDKSVPEMTPSAIRPRPPEQSAPTLSSRAKHSPAPGPEIEKTVHINIGRIEVQAVMPEKRLPPKPVRRTPGLSLEDYLKKQRGGKR